MDTYASSESILRTNHIGPVEGSPLLPPDLLTLILISFILILAATYLYFYKKRRPVILWHKIKLLLVLAICLKLLIIGGGSLAAAYWLLPSPNVISTTPVGNTSEFSPTASVAIVFDRPVSRKDLEKKITPDIPGRWVYEDPTYATHLYRRLVFYPSFNLKPDTNYTINLSNIENVSKIPKPYNYQFSFKTQKSPDVLAVIPPDQQKDITINSSIQVKLTKPNARISEFTFELDPTIEFDTTLDPAGLSYTIKPKTVFQQGTTYNLKVKKTDIILNLDEDTVAERGQTVEQYNGHFITKEAPGIKTFTPDQSNVLLQTPIAITFSQAMNRKSVEENFSLSPLIKGTFTWTDDQTLSFKPEKLSYETAYTVKLAKGTTSTGEGFFENDVVKTFNTIGSVKVESINPSNTWTGVSIRTPIKVTFDQGVNKQSAQSKFSLSPSVPGKFSWSNNTMIFTPDNELGFTTNYTVKLTTGIQSISGLPSKKEFTSSFTTQDSTTKLAVPAYLQKYSLSCEIASLRMALAYRGVHLSEDTIHAEVGQDPTPHEGNIWGDPYSAFVGNINGRQMADGYGVYWQPIARAALKHRNATAFEGWSISQLANELASGNPVVIWVYSTRGTKTSWSTPSGKSIYAVRDEHAVTAVGFVGPAANPTQMIINDPLVGQVYWSRGTFDSKWGIFNNSGVVVY